MSVIDDYLADLPNSQREELNRVRAIVKQAVPDTEETMGYGIPTLKYNGKNLIHFAAFKDHLSLFPTDGPIAELEDRLAKFKTGKGTLQFTEEDPIPKDIIQELVRSRINKIDS